MALKGYKFVKEREYKRCPIESRKLLEEYIENDTKHTELTKRVYKSNIRMFFIWVKANLGNKTYTEITPDEYELFLDDLRYKGYSHSNIDVRHNTLSTFNRYIIEKHSDIYPDFEDFTEGYSISYFDDDAIHDPPDHEEIVMVLHSLIDETEDIYNSKQYIAIIKFMYETGCSTDALLQLNKDLVDMEPIIEKVQHKNDDGILVNTEEKYYMTPEVKFKRKLTRFKFSDYSMDALKDWIHYRGDDECPAMFVMRICNDNRVRPLYRHRLNDVFHVKISPMLGRHFIPSDIAKSRKLYGYKNTDDEEKMISLSFNNKEENLTYSYIVDLEEENESDSELFI